MVSVFDALLWIISNLYISMYPVGDSDADLSLGFGGDISPSPTADIAPPPPPPQMSAGYLFTRIRTDKGMLINIYALGVALVIGFQALLGSRRRRSGSKVLLLPLEAFYTVSFQAVAYTIGLVQSVGAHGTPDSQLLWAVGLLLLLGSVNGMSAFSRHHVEQSKELLANHAYRTLLVLWLLFSRSDVSDGQWVLLAYFLLCWIYSILKMAQRLKALRMASSAHGLVRGATVVADYMEDLAGKHDSMNDLTECKYLVLGEDKDFQPPAKVGPPYLTEVGSSKGKVVTVDMIWKHDSKLLGRSTKGVGDSPLKDTCLSFALFKLLKRRFCGVTVAEAGDPKTLEFVLDGLLAGPAPRYDSAFGVVEMELSFLYDLFYTKYPVLLPANRVLGLVRFFVLLGFWKVLLVDFIAIGSLLWSDYEPPEHTFIFYNNVILIAMILSIDMIQNLAARYSNWAIVQFVCDHVDGEKKPWWKRRRWGCGIRRWLVQRVAAWRWHWRTGKWWSPHFWDNKLGQYSLLNNFDYDPDKTGTNALSRLSLRLMEPTGQGRRRDDDVPLPPEVKAAVLGCLKRTRGLPSVGHSLKKSPSNLQLKWAWELPTPTHTVLVWHIATSMCALKDTDLDPGKCDDLHDDADPASGMCDGTGHVLAHRLIATTLSGYCAYLLAFVPDMLPDNSYKASQILDAVVEEARQCVSGFLKGEDQGRGREEEDPGRRAQDTPVLKPGAALRRLLLPPCVGDSSYKATPDQILLALEKEVGTCLGGGGDTWDMSERWDKKVFGARAKPSGSRQAVVVEDADSPKKGVQNIRILVLGAHLGRQLGWKLLAGFWAELLLFLAPSDNADVHAEHLATGGEFITHLWALLTHAGIVERRPLDVDDDASLV